MCSSTATLLYGIWVTTASLDFAATAYSRLQPVSQAIDLILLRRRLGTLKVEKQRAGVDELPVEVWEMIKKELLPIELRRAKRQAAGEEEDHSFFPGKSDVTTLLTSYGLCVPSIDPWAYASNGRSAIAISLPFRTTKSSCTPQVCAGTDHYPGDYTEPAHAVNTLSPSLFDLPSDADGRFASLVQEYKLKIVKQGGEQIVHSLSPFKTREFWERDEEVQTAKVKASEPRWMIWNSVFPCMMGD